MPTHYAMYTRLSSPHVLVRHFEVFFNDFLPELDVYGEESNCNFFRKFIIKRF